MTASNVMIEYRFSGFRLDVWQRKLFRADGDPVSLSSRAMDTLLVLLENCGETLSKSQLMQAVWPNVVVEENNLNQAISSLRKALGDSKNENHFILTVPLRGYCFVAPVEVFQLPVPGVLAAASTAPVELPATPPPPAAVSAPGTRPSAKYAFIPYALLVLALGAGIALYLNRDSTVSQQEGPGVTSQLATSYGASTVSAETAANVIKNSIAVLPLTNLNPDSDNELFAVGLHDEVINQLTKIRSLRVIARNSVLALLNKQLSMQDLGNFLRVESMMTGTVLFAGEHARISLQMLDTSTGVTLWSETYEANKQDMSEMISIQSDIAANVAAALKAKVEKSEQDIIASLPTASFNAHRYNLAARNAYYQQDFAKVWELSHQAITLDPVYFDALQIFATVNTVLVATPLPKMTSREHYELALESAEKMIELAPFRSEGYTQKAVALGTDKQWAGVSDVIDKLVKIQAPSSDLKHIALLLLCMGDFDRAIEIYEANLLTEPVNFFGRGFLLAAYELAGRSDEAREEYTVGEELNPVWWGDTVNTFLALGRNEPVQDVDELIGISDELKHLLSNADNTGLVKEGLRAFQAKKHTYSAEALYYSAIAAHVGENETALDLMRVALDDVWTSLFWLWLPVYDNTRQLESFKQLLTESGIVDFWQQKGWPEVCQPEGDSFACNWSAYGKSGKPD